MKTKGTPSQRAMLGAQMLDRLAAKQAPGSRTGSAMQRAAEAAAAIVGSSPRSVMRGKRVLEADPELADDVLAGTITITDADKRVRGMHKDNDPTPVPDGFHRWTGNGTGPSAPPVNCPACGSLIQPHLIDQEALK